MRQATKALVLVLAATLMLGVSACGDQTAEANKAIDAANANVKQYTQAGTELEKLMGQAQGLPMDPANAKKALALVDRMKAKLDTQRSAAAAAKSDMAKIQGLDVRQEFKTYAAKEIAVTDTLLKEDPVAQALVADLRQVYALVASGKATQRQVEAIGKKIAAESKQLSDLEATASAQEKASGDYFDAQKLGGGK